MKGEESEAGEEIELGLKTSEDIFPRDRGSGREEEHESAGERPRKREAAEGPEEKTGGERGVEGGAGDALDAGVPLTAGGSEREVERERGGDAVFVVGKNEVFPEFVALEPRGEEEIALLGPLVPIREVAAVAVDGDQFGPQTVRKSAQTRARWVGRVRGEGERGKGGEGERERKLGRRKMRAAQGGRRGRRRVGRGAGRVWCTGRQDRKGGPFRRAR